MAFRSIQITGAPAELKAAAGYFLAVFASGFGLGTVRVLLIAPRLGEIAAVSIELPLLLSISWLACGWSLRRFGVSGGWERRAVVGALAFALLMAAEFGLAVLAFGRPPGAYVAGWSTPAGALGLAGQIAFALMPMVRGRPAIA